jgi:hypothetical protein
VRWSADGNQLAFAVAVPKHKGWAHLYGGIAGVDVDGRDFHIVTSHANNQVPAAWSPHGHRLLYSRTKHGGIYVIDANGRTDRRVTTERPSALAWSPDGSSIIYANQTGGLYEVGVDGRGKVRLTSPANGNLAPSWVGDARTTEGLLHPVTAKSVAAMMIARGIPARASASRLASNPYVKRQDRYSSEVLVDRRFAPPPNHPWGSATAVAGIECYASGSGARRRLRELDRTRYHLGSTERHDYLAGRCVLRLTNDLVDPKWVHQYRDAFAAAAATKVKNTPPLATYLRRFPGFLPPVGARASLPAHGKVLLDLPPNATVYADGHILTDRGVRRLTPWGARLLWSKIRAIGLAAGLFRHNFEAAVVSRQHVSRWYKVCNGRHMISAHVGTSRRAHPQHPLPPAQGRALAQIDALFANATSRLPDRAWADRSIRHYVPSGYDLGFDRAAPDPAKLPSPAREELAKFKPLLHHASQGVTTAQARALIAAFVESGLKPQRDPGWGGLGFRLPIAHPLGGLSATDSTILRITQGVPDGDTHNYCNY